MTAHRLHIIKKRSRQVYLKKLVLCFVALLLGTALSIGVGSNFVAAAHDESTDDVSYKYYKSIEVSYGDTLWDIAEEYMTEQYDSIYEYIDELKSINQLESDQIVEDQYLTVVYYENNFR